MSGYMGSTDEAFETVLASGGDYYKPYPRPDLLETVKLVKKWGCVSVLAHPLLNLERDELEEALPRLREAGLCGFEAYYPKFSEKEKDYLFNLAIKHGLIPSGGSDFHGDIKSSSDLGVANVPYSSYEALKACCLSLK